MKKTKTFHECDIHVLLKTFRIMRITIFLLLVSILQTLANNTYSQVAKLSLDISTTRLVDVLDEIEEQSEFYFLYNEKLINTNREISINVKNEKIDKILDQIFKGTDVVYTILDRKIILAPSYLSETDAQQKSISGKVTDSFGSSLPGVTVVVKGTTQGTVTNTDGKYSLSNVQEDATLIFSFVGMKTQEIPVAGKTSINVTMVEETIGIEEVVAIGYGTVKKKDLTGSITSVEGDVLAKRQTLKVTEALQGALPGVTVSRTGSKPGDNATITKRGITTIGDSNPLVLIDGVIGDINDINPNDIENISVLKDAASCAIYGAKAAAGVILITTRRARTGQFDLSYNYEYGLERPTSIPEYTDAVGYMKATNEIRWNDNNNVGTEFPTYSQDLIENYATLHAQNPNLYPDTDWIGLLMNDNAPRQSHQLSLTGGSEKILSKISLAYDSKDGLVDGISFKRITARANNDININKYLSVRADISYVHSLMKSPSKEGKGDMEGGYMFLGGELATKKWTDG